MTTSEAVFLGAGSRFSAAALKGYVDAGGIVSRVLRLRDRARSRVSSWHLPLEQPDPLVEVMRAVSLGDPDEIQGQDELARLPSGHLGVSACFGSRLTGASLARFEPGVINLHPSLLPAYRGPSPLFWQLRDGAKLGGVTAHWMTDRLDAGPVVDHLLWEIPCGIAVEAAEWELGYAGGAMLARRLAGPGPHALWPGIAQDEASASYQGWPCVHDYKVSPLWSAERAFRFIRGCRHLGRLFPVQVLAERVLLEGALGFNSDRAMNAPMIAEGRTVQIRMNPGVLIGRLAILRG